MKMPVNKFSKFHKYEMNEFSSHDIDKLFDWDMAEIIIKNL